MCSVIRGDVMRVPLYFMHDKGQVGKLSSDKWQIFIFSIFFKEGCQFFLVYFQFFISNALYWKLHEVFLLILCCIVSLLILTLSLELIGIILNLPRFFRLAVFKYKYREKFEYFALFEFAGFSNLLRITVYP